MKIYDASIFVMWHFFNVTFFVLQHYVFLKISYTFLRDGCYFVVNKFYNHKTFSKYDPKTLYNMWRH